MAATDLKPGDVVHLKSNSNKLMTVESMSDNFAKIVYVDDDGHFHQVNIALVALQKRSA